MAEENYYTIDRTSRHEIKVKRSLFIGTISLAPAREDAESFILKIRSEFPNATHHCFAYRIDWDVFRYSDDGEPSGTAGLPIFNTLNKHRLLKTVLVVTRYFGGIKLGTGGLMRAYSLCAEKTIEKALIRKVIPCQKIQVIYSYPFTSQLQKLLHKYHVQMGKSSFGEDVCSELEIPLKCFPQFEADLLQMSAGKVRIIKVEGEDQ